MQRCSVSVSDSLRAKPKLRKGGVIKSSSSVMSAVSYTCSIFVRGPLQFILLRLYFGPGRSFQIQYAAHFLHGFVHVFGEGCFCLSSLSLSRQQHDISDSLFIVHSHALWSWQTSVFGPIRSHCHVHLVDDWPRVGWTLYLLLLHRADESQPVRSSCPRLHFYSRFGLYHVAVVLNFIYAVRSALQFSYSFFRTADGNRV